MNEVYLFRKERFQLGIGFTGKKFRTENGCIDTADDTFQKGSCSVVFRNDRLPVPLVYSEWRLSNSSSARMAFMSV